jgi:hypothetical protein
VAGAPVGLRRPDPEMAGRGAPRQAPRLTSSDAGSLSSGGAGTAAEPSDPAQPWSSALSRWAVDSDTPHSRATRPASGSIAVRA